LVSTDISKAAALHKKIIDEVSRIVVGKDEIKEALLIALVAGGHLLIEGPPGTGKTAISKTFAEVIGGTFKRIQFTPDMMPVDITGFYIYSTDGKSSFVDGPIFANIVLADELNRTTPRTQSALLEAMQERQVTIERKTFELTPPFMVIATQVRAGGEGTFHLTDVQIDRFLLHISSRYPTKEEEKQVIGNIDNIETPNLQVVTSIDEVKEIQELAKKVVVVPEIADYIVSIIQGLRTDPDVVYGPSPRGGIALYKCARVEALFDGRDYVIPDDVKRLAQATLEHRFQIKPESEIDGITAQMILDRTMEKIPVPKL
jgi:MoxR-like ATPase